MLNRLPLRRLLTRLCPAFITLLCACGLEEEPLRYPGRFPGLDAMPPLARLDSSRKALAWMKAASGNSYTYWMNRSSPLSGGQSRTRLVVRSGTVVERRYAWTPFDRDGRPTRQEESYVETGADVGESEHGMPAWPLDSLYAECGRSLAAAAPRDRIVFELDEDSILRECGTFIEGIQDQFHPQVHITGLEWDP